MDRYPNQVSCHFGWTHEALPRMIESLGPIDFMFHDAGHSKEDYLRDFDTALPVLAPGAVVLIDDIRWEDPRFSFGQPPLLRRVDGSSPSPESPSSGRNK